MMRLDRVGELVKYAVAAASQKDDWKERELGPIHLIKYVYLADLAYAEGHKGQTYTEIEWKFHHFGPWSFPVYEHLDSALVAPFQRKQIRGQYDKDMIRWSLPQNEAYRRPDFEKILPMRCALAIDRAVKLFGSDTRSLLHEVYRTQPMIDARPGASLIFKGVEDKLASEVDPESKSLRRKLRKRAREIRGRRVGPKGWNGNDEYLDVGMNWLNDLEQSEFEETAFSAEFDPSVWEIGLREKDD